MPLLSRRARLVRTGARSGGLAALAFAVLVVSVACGGDSTEDAKNTAPVTVQVATAPATPPGWVDQVLREPTPAPTPPPYDGQIARLALPRLGINHTIEELGILPGGEMDTPKAANTRIGWYFDFPKPGFGKNAIFSAHETYNAANGPFRYLYLAEPGDEITVEMDNGTAYTYVVFSNQRYDVTSMPMNEIIYPGNKAPNEEWITLITCGGRFVAIYGNGLGEYLDRDVVVAKRLT